MSGPPPPNQQPMRSSLSRGPPSPIHYRPPSPWAPSPPPIISGPRRPFNSPGAGQPQHMGSPMSPPITNYNNTMPRSQPMSPMPPGGASGLRGTRGTNVTQPRPRWPGPPHQSTPPPHPMVCPSPPTLGGVNGPRPYRPGPMHSYSPGPMSSFQLSPTPSPVVCQTPSDYMYSAPFEQPPRNQYEYAGVPPEPPKSYIIYDDEEDQGPSTAEIIANQSQDYVDEKLAEYQMTILQLQGKSFKTE